MPQEVLEQAAGEMLNWHGSGMGVMEMSHRGKEFIAIYEQAEADLRDLLRVPDTFKILFMQGGGLAENAIVPLNLSRGQAADFVITGSWSQKSSEEAKRYCDAHVAASNKGTAHTTLPEPATWQLREEARYVHVCSNETIHGVELHELPDLAGLGSHAPLVIDCSSHIASRPIDWQRVGLAFAGAQKNLGPAGLTLVVVREDLLGHALSICPGAFDYKNVAANQSMYNTPPTFGIYMAGLVFQWIKRQGGIASMERAAIERSQLLYDTIDASKMFMNPVTANCRSRMNIPFFIREEAGGQSATDAFLEGAKARGLLQLKGHKSVGGLRASLYNAMPMAGVHALVDYMRTFEQQGGKA